MMGGYSDAAQQRWAAQVARADGYVLVTPEYNHGYPAVLKNALDHLFSEWNGKPVAFVGYGGPGGGLRAVEQLRQVVVELEMVPMRQQVAIAGVYAAFDQDGRLATRSSTTGRPEPSSTSSPAGPPASPAPRQRSAPEARPAAPAGRATSGPPDVPARRGSSSRSGLRFGDLQRVLTAHAPVSGSCSCTSNARSGPCHPGANAPQSSTARPARGVLRGQARDRVGLRRDREADRAADD
jgi:hypothetical protein